jgi:hypothetical protein
MQFTNGSIVQCARLFTFVMCLALSRVGLCQLDQHFAADENIETLTVELAVAHDGMELSEPVALDLGLGFPLWLIPRLGDEGGPPAFGALPQRATLSQAVPAGERANFTFDVRAVDGSDVLKTNLQLLGGVRVSDISRIGLCAEGRTDWQLELLEIQINGKLFHRSEGASRHIQDEQALAHIRLREVSSGIESLRADAERLRELVDCGLATTNDEVQELADFEEVLVPQLQEQNRIERQIAGSYPWFIDAAFHSPWRNGHLLQSMAITLVTAPHTGADTRNFVYYSSGGRKYLLSSSASPLTPEHGPQTFQLDLIGGPATAADLRGHSLGMLSNGIPYSAAPDRYHAARLLVEVDGRVVYDSDEVELDRLSLEAIRLIPPAHLDGAGSVVLNTPLPREAIVWEAGSGSGLDLVNGGAQPLPPPTDSAWPDPEPSVVYDDAWAASELHDGFSEGYGPFPGETCFDEEWVTTWEEPWPSGGWEPGSGVGPGGGWGSGGDPWAYLHGVGGLRQAGSIFSRDYGGVTDLVAVPVAADRAVVAGVPVAATFSKTSKNLTPTPLVNRFRLKMYDLMPTTCRLRGMSLATTARSKSIWLNGSSFGLRVLTRLVRPFFQKEHFRKNAATASSVSTPLSSKRKS